MSTCAGGQGNRGSERALSEKLSCRTGAGSWQQKRAGSDSLVFIALLPDAARRICQIIRPYAGSAAASASHRTEAGNNLIIRDHSVIRSEAPDRSEPCQFPACRLPLALD